jgi:hypothetical protein
MSTITISTPPANRQLLSEAFGMNQTAVRYLESMVRDITINIPDAIDNSSAAAAIQFLQMSVNGLVSVQRAPDPFSRLLFESVASRQPDRNGILARLEGASFVGQAPGNYRAQQPLVGFSQSQTTGTSLTSGTTANAASIALAAGTWDISGVCVFNSAVSTVLERVTAGIGTTSATLGTPDTYQQLPEALSGADPLNLEAPLTRVVLANAATVYLVAQAVFTTSTLTVDGYIKARPAL